MLTVAVITQAFLLVIGGAVLVAILVDTRAQAQEAKIEASICASRVVDLRTYVAERLGKGE